VLLYLGRRGLEFVGKSREKMSLFRDEDVSNALFLTTLLHDWRMLDHVGWKHDKHVDKLLLTNTVAPSKCLSHLVGSMIDRWEQDYQIGARQVFGDLLCFLVVARAGVTEEDLLGLVKADPSALGAFLTTAREMFATKTGVYHIKHHVVQNIVIHKYMSNTVDVEGVRAVIIDYFTDMGLDKERAALELTYQFQEAGRKADLLETIKSLGVFNTFFSSGLESEIVGYWGTFDADSRMIAEVYDKALRSLEAAGAEGMTTIDQRKVYGISLDNYESMARLLSHLGRFLSRTGQNLAGIDILKRLVAVHERINPGSAHVASISLRVAQQYWKIGYYAEGLPFADSALKLYTNLYGHESLQLADGSYQAALMYLGLQKLDEAEKLMNVTVKIREQLLGRDHQSVADALLQMGKISTRLGNKEDAQEYQLRANRVMGARSRKLQAGIAATRTKKDAAE